MLQKTPENAYSL